MIHFKNLLSIDLKHEFDANINNANSKSPREHQVLALSEMSKFFSEQQKKSGILVLPTGGGKTYTSIYWLLKNIISNNGKILWLADQGFLLEQARESFKENILLVDHNRRSQVDIRLVSGSDKHANPNQIAVSDDILLITSQTAISNWNDNANTNFKKFINESAKNENLFIVYDEAHHTPAFGRRNLLIGGSEDKIGIIEKYPNTRLLGLTATPTYTNKSQLGWLWKIFKGGVIYEVSKKKLEDQQILASPIFIQQKTNFNLVLSDSDVEKLLIKHQELPSHIIEEIAENESRNDFIAQYYCDNAKQFGKTIIFLDRWYQCKMVENYINRKAGKIIALSLFSSVDGNKNVEYINSRKSNQNDINLEKFKNDEIDVLINIKMLTEGVDVPNVKSIFLTRDTNSGILFTQMVGRALRGRRAGGNKDTANIVLFSDNWNRHIQFASSNLIGGLEENSVKERGFRPLELIRIDLLDQLQIEYQNKNYDKSIFEMIPIGWYVVEYDDTIQDFNNEENLEDAAIETFKENVIVLENEKDIFLQFINNYESLYKRNIWEKEELDLNEAEDIMTEFLNENNYQYNRATLNKLIQIARHLGRNRNQPDFFTFNQKNEIDLMKHVLLIRDKNYGRDQAEEYLESQYLKTENPFFRVLFASYEAFYKAYEYEDNVYRRNKKNKVSILEASQEFSIKRLVDSEVRKKVLSRDGYRCLCCGKNKESNLQIDHIISFKLQEPKNDDPELYQTLCGVCNREKSSNSYNYRITNYDLNKMALENVLTTKNANEDPDYYFTRLINCYFKTSATQPNSVTAINHGHSIWKAEIKLGIDPETTILKEKDRLLEIIKSKGFKLKDIQIISK